MIKLDGKSYNYFHVVFFGIFSTLLERIFGFKTPIAKAKRMEYLEFFYKQ
jgi:hypothetical protein